MKVMNVFWASVVLVTLSHEAVAQSKTVFSGLPTVKISEGGLERAPETLPRETAVNLACVISEIGGRYYWASRENRQLTRHQGGAFTTFFAVDGSGYVRLVSPEFKGAARLLSPTEATFDYVEHALVGLRSVTYYGVANERGLPRESASPNVEAPITAPAQRTGEVARFAQDAVRSLASARDARKALSEAQSKGALADASLNLMTAYRRAITKLRSADSLLAPHSDSSRERIAETASSTRTVYALLVAAFEGGLRAQETLVDMNPAQPLGPVVSEASKYTAMAEEAWKALPSVAAAGLSHALVDTERTTTDGKLGFLSVTELERADLLKTIELLFGEEVAAGEKVAGLHPPEASASLLARFLRQPWGASDKK